MKITKKSILTGKVSTQDLPITDLQLIRWKAGALIQEAMPDLTADQREFLMTGITADEWEAMAHE